MIEPLPVPAAEPSTERVSQAPHMVLAYHEVVPKASDYLYRVSADQFRGHASFFARERATGGAAPAITFDDGHCSNFDCAFPALEEMGLRATFFVLAGCVGTSPEYLTWAQLREMAAAGHQVASHGWSHRLLTQCSPHELEQELVQSKRELEDRLGVEIASISMPGGRWNDRVIAASSIAGYKFVFHSHPWMPNRISHGVQLQGRLMVTNAMDVAALGARMNATGLRRLYLRARQDAKDNVRAALGDSFYHRLWCFFANYDPRDGMEVQIGKGRGV